MVSGITLTLTEREAEYLKDIIDAWLDGCQESTTDIEQDMSIDSIDDFIKLTQEIRVIHLDASIIRTKLTEAIGGHPSSV